ncbi:envelope stress response membrane protein PspB [Sphingomonas phyllosphaerae]|uniref:envelope stress response membrane protein PspB n=1 Tax=Sphingomonas phyllosphaerae TaxID=257003 RepID=UPI000428CCC4|nr:envelope stress response membrane protein PspB [Sphingomonas phyllosphaerae]
MDFAAMVAILAFLIGLPWLILHYVTKWKTAPKMTGEDEQLLDEMYNLARRLEDRVNTVERIVAADNPDFRPGVADYRSAADYRLDHPTSQRRN